MGKYDVLYRLKLEHEYYTNGGCRGIDLRPTSTTLNLLRRRGFVFRQTEANEWCLLGGCDKESLFMEESEFQFDLYLVDPSFVYYTQWEKLNLSSLYHLALPVFKNGNFIEKVKTNDNKRKVGSGFCLASLRFNKNYSGEMPDNVFDNVLEFQTKEVIWEYVFVDRRYSDINHNVFFNPLLVEEDGKIEFTAVESGLSSSQGIFRFKSSEPIKMAESYKYHLLLRNEIGGIKLLDEIPFPVPGQFLNFNMKTETEGEVGVETIRQVCYF